MQRCPQWPNTASNPVARQECGYWTFLQIITLSMVSVHGDYGMFKVKERS